MQRTTDPDEAATAITDAYAPHKMQITGTPNRFDMRLWSNSMPGLDFGYIQLGTDVRLYAPPPPYYIVVLAGAGRVRIGSKRDSVLVSGSSGVITSLQEPVFFEDWSQDCRLVTARFKPVALERVLASLLGRSPVEPIRFNFRMDLGGAREGSFLRALQLLRTELQRPDGMTSDPVMAGGLAGLVMTGLLRGQPHNYSDQLSDVGRAEPPAVIRNAVELIETRAADILSVTDVARGAGLSVRALEEGFRRHVGMPPMAYLRELKLARIHSELQRSEPDQTTAAAVARRWGFNHYGRFTATYRARYGASPVETLQRSPSVLSRSGVWRPENDPRRTFA
ncbi:AraC family transcriptional regulator [Rhodococcus sp. T2V]|uniref:AraC family transcriptional regulator n=1 Tax=Rhodococcus sp. T2V TaxID=3034164 RepID=UPI0023E2D6AC|nr:AraC family transcriptional regulator [Rhodococcus sp. T2V]